MAIRRSKKDPRPLVIDVAWGEESIIRAARDMFFLDAQSGHLGVPDRGQRDRALDELYEQVDRLHQAEKKP